MLKLTLRNLAANKGRLTLTGLAVVLGVGFVVASLITSDGLRRSFEDLSRDVAGGSDLTVRPVDDFSSDPITDSTLDQIRTVDGVSQAAGLVSAFVQPVIDGQPMSVEGAPLIGVNVVDDTDLVTMTVVEGSSPSAGQFMVDIDSARDHGFEIGQDYTMITDHGVRQFTLSGIHRFGEDNGLLGAVLMGFTTEDARTLAGLGVDQYDELAISVGSGRSASSVEQAIGAELADGLEVVNQKTVQEETAVEFNDAISVLTNIFLGFAGVSLVVAVFIIYNTFGVVLAQRVREIGLLRAVGATSNQIRRGIVVEALIVGIVASVLGVVTGIALHVGLLAAFGAMGMDLPDSELILAPRTVIVGMTIGLVATMLSALLPALRAGSVSPIQAMNGTVITTGRPSRRLTILGVVLGVIGVGLGGLGLQGLSSTGLTVAALAVGALSVFISVTVLSPWAARPVIAVLARPVGLIAGPAGSMAGRNSVRHPGRTATTAGSLMVGLALITAAMVVGDSFRSQLSSTLTDSTRAELLISDPSFNDFTTEVADRVESIPELGTVASVSSTPVRVTPDGAGEASDDRFAATDLAAMDTLFDLSVDAGSFHTDVENPLVMPSPEAAAYGLSIGDELTVAFPGGGQDRFRLVATYTDQSLIDTAMMEMEDVQRVVDLPTTAFIAADVADGYTAEQAMAALAGLSDEFPQIEARDSDTYAQEVSADIDSVLNAISLMLALALIIALIGIGLTLALAVVERTREIGLLRAVGMTRRQTRRMIRWEAALIAAFGAVLGMATGLVFGWAAVVAIPDGFISTVSVPVTRLAIMVALAAIAGLIAAMLPARRAGRMNVLDAIAGS